MRKLLSSLMLFAAAAMAFSSCTNNEISADKSETAGEVTVFHITASAPGTRTVFGAKAGNNYPTLWTNTKKVAFSYDESTFSDETPNVDAGKTTASFDVKFTGAPASGTIYAFSPKGDFNSTPKVPGFTGFTTYSDSKAIYLNIPTEQTPLENSVDESAQAIVAEATYTDADANVNMVFHHIVAYGKMAITNFAGTIKSVELQFPENVAGASCKCLYKETTPSIANVTSSSITLNPANVSGGVFWFALAPTAGTTGEMKVIITDTNDDTYTKTLDLATKALPFNAGKVSSFSVNFLGVAKYSVSGEYSTTFNGTEYLAPGSSCMKDGLPWVLNTNSNYIGGSATNGVQIGKAADPATSASVTTSKYSDNVNKVVVSTKGSSDINATVSISVNGTSYLCDGSTSKAISTTETEYTFVPDGEAKTGTIVISWQQTTSKAIYLKGITINKAATPIISPISNPANIDAAGETSSVSYVITNPNGGSVSASSAESWISDFDYSTSGTISFTVAKNEGTDSRSSVVTVSYPGAENVTFTVTQDGSVKTSTFTIKSGDVVSSSSYAKYEYTDTSKRNWLITFGGNTKSIGTNSGNRSKCTLGSYSQYAVSPVTTSDIATVFACTTKLDDIKSISYTFNGGSNQTKTNVYVLYSADGKTYSQITLTGGTQGATISSGTTFSFAKCSGYFAILFKCTNSTGNWRIDDVNLTFTY